MRGDGNDAWWLHARSHQQCNRILFILPKGPDGHVASPLSLLRHVQSARSVVASRTSHVGVPAELVAKF